MAAALEAVATVVTVTALHEMSHALSCADRAVALVVGVTRVLGIPIPVVGLAVREHRARDLLMPLVVVPPALFLIHVLGLLSAGAVVVGVVANAVGSIPDVYTLVTGRRVRLSDIKGFVLYLR